MSGLTWIHLSDWHQKGKDFDRQVVRDKLMDDIRNRAAISPALAEIDFIVFSGDVAYSGKDVEYQAAKKEFFEHLSKASGIKPESLFIVPGNHDLDRDVISKLPTDLKKPLETEAEVQKWLTNGENKEMLLKPFEAFAGFVSAYTRQENPDYANIRRCTINGRDIALLGLNSAWMCGRKDAAGKVNDRGFVLVGEPQIHEPLQQIAGAKVSIAVLHHSFDWLAEFDFNRVEARLTSQCNFILHGHGHKPQVKSIKSASGNCVVIPAGAGFEDRSFVNAYNFVHLNFDAGMGVVFLRRWNDWRNEWVEDDSCDGGRFEFRLPWLPASPPPRPGPHQIPPPPQDFTGREQEISELLASFEKGATITGVRGMGGIGKTALALVLADKLEDSFPDGQIFVDLRGTSDKPLTTAEAMAHVIRAYHPEVKMPENENDLRGLYYSVLSSKSALLLLDNASDREQVEPLLPPPGCAVIITSRNKFALPGLENKDLDVLPLIDAENLLLEIAGRIGSRAEELARLCGCLPIALRNAAYALAERKDLGVDEYLNRLKDAKKRLELVEASFSLSYELLSPELQGLWSMLSVFPADFDRAGAAAVWNVESDSAAEALSDLFKLSLVEYLEATGRYHLHDLARDFAASCLEAAAEAEAQQRHAVHYLQALSNANDFFLQGQENTLAGLRMFDIERMNIQTGQAWAEQMVRQADGSEKESIEIALCLGNGYPDAGAHVLDLRLHPDEKILWLKTAVTSAHKLEDKKFEGAHLGNLGLAYSDLGETRKAIDYHEQALVISREIGDRRGEGADLGNLGLALDKLGHRKEAIERMKEALKIFEQIESPSAGNARRLLAKLQAETSK